jgi:hypothetical protein
MKMNQRKIIQRIGQKYAHLSGAMDQRLRRRWAALEAMDLGWGGVTTVARATGLDRHTILAGTRELEQRPNRAGETTRAPGGGRKPLSQTDPGLLAALEALMEPVKPAHPDWPLRWTCQSTAKLAQELRRQNHPVSDRTVASLLHAAGYSLQDNRRCNEKSSHADRNAQFEFINELAAAFQSQGQPVVWLDTKKSALTGLDHDTARLAAASMGRWWQAMGAKRFPNASKLLITADVGGSNSNRSRLWNRALQDLANELGLMLEISHLPPATCKWNKIEHDFFSGITHHGRGRLSISYEAIVNLIAPTPASDRNHSQMNISPAKSHSEWNYALRPLQIL